MREEMVTQALAAFNAIREIRSEPIEFRYDERKCEPHWQAAQDALARIAIHPCLPGMWDRLREHDFDLYRAIQVTLPEEIDRLWDDAAPMDGFQKALDRWVDAHHQACDRFKMFI